MAFKNIEEAREYDRKRSKDPRRREQLRRSARRRWAEDPSVRERHKVTQDRWEEENHKERNEYRADWAKKDRDTNKELYRHNEHVRDTEKYGVPIEWYRDRLIEQRGLCALCFHLNHVQGTLQRLTIDHDHECCNVKTKSCGKCVRGLLCNTCNLRLSTVEVVLKESTIIPTADTWLYRAVQYLDSYKMETQQCTKE